MGYYIGGDREDEGNYTSSFIKKKVNAPKKPPLPNIENLDVTKGIALPTEFDPDYFKEKQSKGRRFQKRRFGRLTRSLTPHSPAGTFAPKAFASPV